MQSTWRVVVVLLACLAISSGQAWALNPADPTGLFRYGTNFLKVGYDGIGSDASSSWLFVQTEVDNKTAVMVYNSNDLSCDKHLYEVGVTKQVKTGEVALEIGAFADLWHNDEDNTGLMLDWSNSQFGIGLVADINGSLTASARAKVAARTKAYVSADSGGPVMLGLGQKLGTTQLDVGASRETVIVRASQPAGRYFPELQLKFKDGDRLLGLRLGMIF